MSDIICTSSNAEKIVKSLPVQDKIIFAPDRNLGNYIASKTGREMSRSLPRPWTRWLDSAMRRSIISWAGSFAPPTSLSRHIKRRIRGIAGVVGCNNARVTHDDPNLTLIKELIKNDVLVLVTGCSAMTCGKAGLLTPEATDIYAGAGLASVGKTVGIPPVLHMAWTTAGS
jgi:hypothetical protein